MKIIKRKFFYPTAVAAITFIIGAVGYYLIEILYRGHSHWTMALCGGLSLLTICYTDKKLKNKSIVLRALIGAIIITAIEFICGCIVNIGFGMSVWDYSNTPFNLLGQICLIYSFFWFLISAFICGIFSIARKAKRSSHV